MRIILTGYQLTEHSELSDNSYNSSSLTNSNHLTFGNIV